MRMRGIALALTAALTVTACGADATDEPTDTETTPTSTPAPADTDESPGDSDARLSEPFTVRFATVNYFGLEHLAAGAGLDEKYNLNFEITPASSHGVPSVQAVAGGQADSFQSNTLDSWYKAIAGGVDLLGVVSGYVSSDDPEAFEVYKYYVRADSGITSAEDLEGMRMGTITVGSFADVPMDLYLTEAGLDPSSVERVNVPFTELPTALINGQIDVLAAFDAVYSRVEAEFGDEVNLLFTSQDTLPTTELATSYGVTREFAEENPDVMRAYVAVMKDAAEFVRTNEEEARQIISEATGTDAEVLVIPVWPENLCMDLSYVPTWFDAMVDLGYVDEGVVQDPASHFTNEFNPDC